MDYNLIEMCLLGLLAFIGLSVLVSLIIYYRNIFKAKKSWKLEYVAELDITENMKNNLNKMSIFIKIFLGFIIINTLFGIYLVLFKGAPYSLLLICMCPFIIVVIIHTMTKKPKYVKLKICDNGILFKDSYKKWSDYKGYYKKGDYLCLILNNGLNNMVQYLKYSEELENIIKTHLKVITNTKDNG